MKKLGLAGLVAAGLLLAPTVASAQLCPLGLIVKSIYIGNTQHRELTEKEAATCGLITEDVKPAAKKKMSRAKKPS
ncbi:MAG: hypothetical protein JO254_04395 [Pseudolabrys sp.]|nr:hypothetical protein [Pseudolabrys sp.]